MYIESMRDERLLPNSKQNVALERVIQRAIPFLQIIKINKQDIKEMINQEGEENPIVE